jgi:CubicO group peptidase (beta-lactamase class C family)
VNSIYRDPPPFPFGGAGLISSPRDYDRFLTMLLGGGVFAGKRVMGARAVALGTSNLLPPGATTAGTWIAGHGFGAGACRPGRRGGHLWLVGRGGHAGLHQQAGRRARGLFTQYMPAMTYPLEKDFPQAVRSDVRARLLLQNKVPA